MWVAIGIGVLVVAALALTVAAIRASRDRDPITAEQIFQLGVIFTGTGIALATTIGPSGLGILGLGVVYMVLGAVRRRESSSD